MSKTKRSYLTVLPIANKILDRLAPACERIELAGSLRRQRPEIGDIELIAIPKLNTGLFPNVPGAVSKIELLDIWKHPSIKVIKGGSKYKQFSITTTNGHEYQIDLFLQPDPATWGVNMMIRTGSKEFSRRMVTAKQNGGFKPWQYEVDSARVVDRETGDLLPTPNESDVFKLWGMDYIEPQDRQ